MSELNTTVGNISKEEGLLKKIEEYEQQLYETKRQLATSKLMEQELSTELEALQHNESSDANLNLKKISNLEEEIASIKLANSEHINQLEQELNDKDTEIETLRNKVNVAPSSDDKRKEETIGKLNEELYDLKCKNESLLHQIDDQQLLIKDLTKQKNNYVQRLDEICKEVEDLREFLAIKRQELEATNERFTNLQDELTVTQMELSRLKNDPVNHNKKGNSLFAEVEDNRQQLKKYIHDMNKKYAEMKISYNRKATELQSIQEAYMTFKSQIKENNSIEADQTRLKKAYEDTIENFKENNKALEQELILRKEATAKILSGNQKSNEALIEISRKEIMELRSQMKQKQYTCLASEKSLYDATAELKQLRVLVKSVQTENLILQQKLKDLEFKLTNADKPSESKTNSQTEKEKPATKSAPKLVPTTLDVAKYGVSAPNKQEITKFCNIRTLTIVENDLMVNDEEPKYNIPDFSKSGFADISFEKFDDELSLTPVVSSNLRIESTTEANKENTDNNQSRTTVESGKMKRKVSFTDNAADDKEDNLKSKINTLRGGKILVPKKKIVVVSNAVKKV